MIGAGVRDRRIKLFPQIDGRDSAGGNIKTDGLAIEMWAKKFTPTFTTKYVNDKQELIADVEFTVPWMRDIVMPCRVKFEDVYFDVKHIQELGYHQDLRLVCKKSGVQKAI